MTDWKITAICFDGERRFPFWEKVVHPETGVTVFFMIYSTGGHWSDGEWWGVLMFGRREVVLEDGHRGWLCESILSAGVEDSEETARLKAIALAQQWVDNYSCADYPTADWLSEHHTNTQRHVNPIHRPGLPDRIPTHWTR